MCVVTSHSLFHFCPVWWRGSGGGRGLERALACHSSAVSCWHAPPTTEAEFFKLSPSSAARTPPPSQTSCRHVPLLQTGSSPGLNAPCSLRTPDAALGDILVDFCGRGSWDPQTGHHAPAVGCALDHSHAPVSGGGTVLQRPV